MVHFGKDRVALKFGNQKINLHEQGKEFEPNADHPTPGPADLCLLTPMGIEKAIAFIHLHHIDIIEGPVEKTGANGSLVSIYFRDPDHNLIELSNVTG